MSNHSGLHVLISKLGHQLEEIRVRSLQNLSSKLEYGIVSVNDLMSDNTILSHLFNWFGFPSQPENESVLKLILNLSKDPIGKQALIAANGVNFLTALRAGIETRCHRFIDEILEQLYYSNDVIIAENNEKKKLDSGSCNEFTSPRFSQNDQIPEKFFEPSLPADVSFETTYFEEPVSHYSEVINQNAFYFINFPWVALNNSDVHVLLSTDELLQNEDPKKIVEMCKFLRSILFQDFPAEIFLQRPQIFCSLLQLIRSHNAKPTICVESIRCLHILASKLKARIKYYLDPTLGHAGKCSMASSTVSTSRLSAQDLNSPNLESPNAADCEGMTPIISENSYIEADLIEPDLVQLQLMQINILEFCVRTLRVILPLCREIHCELLMHIVPLLHLSIDLIEMTFRCALVDDSITFQNVAEEMNNCLILLSTLLQHHSLKLSSTDDDKKLQLHRIIYLCLVNISIRLLGILNEPTQGIGIATSQPLFEAMTPVLFDPAIYLCYPNLHSVLLEHMKYQSSNLIRIYDETMQICKSMKCAHIFLNETKNKMYSDGSRILSLVEDSLFSLPYHKYPVFIQRFISFLSHCKHDEYTILEKGRMILVTLMKHKSQVIRLITYRSCHELIKKVLRTPRNKSLTEMGRIRFLVDSKVLLALCQSGLFDDNSQVVDLSRDIIIYLVQSRILLGDPLWSELSENLLQLFPLLQGFADSISTLGRAITKLTDIETSSFSSLELLRGTIRLMFTSDHQLRTNTLANLAWFLKSEIDSKKKLPVTLATDLLEKSNLLIPALDNKYVSLKNLPSDYQIGLLKNTLQIVSSDIETEIRRAAIGQLPQILADTRLHEYFIENGMDTLMKLITSGLLKDSETSDLLPVCFHTLMILLVFNPALRHTIYRDEKIYLQLLRGALIFLNNPRTHLHICVTLALLLFKDEFVETERIPPMEGGDAVIERVFSLPPSIVNRYVLPLKVTELPNQDEKFYNDDTHLYSCDHAKQMLSVFWNIYWLNGIEQFIETKSLESDGFSSILQVTAQTQQIVSITYLIKLLERTLQDIKEANSHREVRQSLSLLRLLVVSCHSHSQNGQLGQLPWQDSFDKYLAVHPTSNADKRLLKLIIEFFVFILAENFIPISEKMENWFCNNLFTTTSGLYFIFSNQSVNVDVESKSLCTKLVRFVTALMKREHMLMRKELKIGDIVYFVLSALSVAEAAQFYNLASLEAIIRCLMYLTTRSGWSITCTKMNELELCQQILSTLMDIIIAFHVGLGKSNDRLMGKGVTLAASVLLQHLVSEMNLHCEGEKWVELWLSQNQRLANDDQVVGLMWIVPLWVYRDQEVRSASLGVAVGLSKSTTGYTALATNLNHISGGIWGAAFSFFLDANEATCVKEQAALLLVNLTKHLYNNSSLAQTLKIRDPSTQEPLIGVDALRTLLYRSDFFKTIAQIITCYIQQPFAIPYSQNTNSNGDEILSSLSPVGEHEFENHSVRSQGFGSVATPDEASASISSIHLITPTLINNLCQLLHNLLLLVPNETFIPLNSQLLGSLLSCIDANRVIYVLKSHSFSPLFTSDLLKMQTSILSLTCSCVVKNAPTGSQMTRNSNFVRTVFELLNTHLIDINHCARNLVYDLWSKIYKLLWLLVSTNDQNTLVHTYLSTHSRRVINNIIPVLDKCTAEKTWLNCLKYFSTYYKERRMTFKYLDEPCDTFPGMDLEVATLGSALCHLLIQKYGDLFNKLNQDFMASGIVLNALATLLAVSDTAKDVALKAELPKKEIQHLSDIYVSITLASLDNIKMSNTKKMETPWQQTLILHFDLLQCFLHNCHDAKVQCSQNGLSGILHQLWCWCLQPPILLLSLLSLLCTYTANCRPSTRSVAYTSSVQGAGNLKTLGTHSLVHALIRLANTEMDRANAIKDMTLVSLVMQTLTNVCLGSECRSIICKTNFLDGFMKLNAQQAKKNKHQEVIDNLWLSLLLSMTFNSDGQDAVLRVAGISDLLIDFAGSKSSVSVKACQVLRNLCCTSTANKSYLLNSDRILRVLIAFINNESQEDKPIAASALWALIANCQKAKVMLRSVTLIAQLQRICLECGTSDYNDVALYKHINQVLNLCQFDNTKSIL